MRELLQLCNLDFCSLAFPSAQAISIAHTFWLLFLYSSHVVFNGPDLHSLGIVPLKRGTLQLNASGRQLMTKE